MQSTEKNRLWRSMHVYMHIPYGKCEKQTLAKVAGLHGVHDVKRHHKNLVNTKISAKYTPVLTPKKLDNDLTSAMPLLF